MKKDLRSVIEKISLFLGKEVPQGDRMQGLLDHLSFDKMKNNKAVNKEDFVQVMVVLRLDWFHKSIQLLSVIIFLSNPFVGLRGQFQKEWTGNRHFLIEVHEERQEWRLEKPFHTRTHQEVWRVGSLLAEWHRLFFPIRIREFQGRFPMQHIMYISPSMICLSIPNMMKYYWVLIIPYEVI